MKLSERIQRMSLSADPAEFISRTEETIASLSAEAADLEADRDQLKEQLDAHIDFVKQYQRQVARLEAELERTERAMLQANERVRRGLSGPPLQFRCSHCGEESPIIINKTLALAHEALADE